MAKRDDFIVMPALSERASPEEIAAAFDEMGAKARSTYDETTSELQIALRTHDPVAILARMRWRFFAAQGATNSDQQWPAAQQHHLELLQALALVNDLPAEPKAGRVCGRG